MTAGSTAARARILPRVVAAALAAGVVPAVGGCTSSTGHAPDRPSPASVVTTVPRSAPGWFALPTTEPTSDDDLWGVDARRSSTDPTQVELVTTGSGSCPLVPTSLTWEGDELTAVVDEDAPAGGACTADLGPSTTTIAVTGHDGAFTLVVQDRTDRTARIAIAAAAPTPAAS